MKTFNSCAKRAKEVLHVLSPSKSFFYFFFRKSHGDPLELFFWCVKLLDVAVAYFSCMALPGFQNLGLFVFIIFLGTFSGS